MSRSFLFALACCCLAGCSVASVDTSPSPSAENSCQSSSDCGGGVCGGGRCVGASGQLRTFLLQVTPSSDATPVAGVQLQTQTVSDLGGTLNLTLAQLVDVNGRITVGQIGCTPSFVDKSTLAPAADGSIPAQVTLTPSEQGLGVYSAPRVVQATWHLKDKSYSFRAPVPPGDYDIYVEPGAQPDDSPCILPPELVRKVSVTSSLTIDMPAPSPFQLDVAWPPQTDTLDNWYADMLDPVSGRVISNRVPLMFTPGPDPIGHYVASLLYAPVAGDSAPATGQELLRLQMLPPMCLIDETPAGSCGNVATPTLLMARSALSVFNKASGTLTQFTQIPKTVHVEGQVARLGQPVYVQAQVTLIAKQLDGIDPGLFAAFRRTVDTGADGTFATDLLPGSYAVYTVPGAEYGLGVQCGSSGTTPCLAQATQAWEIGDSPASQGGRVIELSSAIPVVGAVADFSGHPVVGAQVLALASPAPLAQDVLAEVLGNTDSLFVPRASGDIVLDTGGFKIWTDPGTFDLSVRPQAGTGFAWLVRPSVMVPSDAYTSGLNLGAMQMPLPIPYSGAVEYPGASGAGALIRAYVYMQSTGTGMSYTEDPQAAQAVLQVAETRADASGHFELLIPAKLNP